MSFVGVWCEFKKIKYISNSLVIFTVGFLNIILKG